MVRYRIGTWTILSILVATSVTVAEVPSWIASSDTTAAEHPLWVSAEEAAPNGFLRWDLFDPNQQDWFRTSLQRNPEERAQEGGGDVQERCSTWIYPSGGGGKADSPAELLDRAGVVYRATVTDVAPGFLNGSPGTMIEATVQEVIKPPRQGEPLEQILIFYRYAVIEVDGGFLCVRDLREPATPRIGGIVVLAPHDARADYPDLNVFWVEDDELFFEATDGELSAPSAYGQQLTNASALTDALRAAAARAGGEP